MSHFEWMWDRLWRSCRVNGPWVAEALALKLRDENHAVSVSDPCSVRGLCRNETGNAASQRARKTGISRSGSPINFPVLLSWSQPHRRCGLVADERTML